MSLRVQAESVSFAYDTGAPVLERAGAAVNSGELLGIVGPNGSGKSTLLRLLAGVLKPKAGHVLIDGKEAFQITPRQRARIIGFLPQTVNPIFSMRVLEVVCLGRFPHLGAFGAPAAHDYAIADRCLRDTETVSLRERDFLSLSGGERQRVLLASILAQEPRLLLLDEPTSALDVHHQIEIFTLLGRLRAAGFGIAVVTHDINLAARFCDRILLLGQTSRGVIAAGVPAEVVTERLLSTAYGAPIRVCTHPLTNTPLVTVDTPVEAAP